MGIVIFGNNFRIVIEVENVFKLGFSRFTFSFRFG